MSILKYFRPVKQKLALPDPNGSLSEIMSSLTVSSANAKVLENKQVVSSQGV